MCSSDLEKLKSFAFWYNLNSFILWPKGKIALRGLYWFRFWRFMPKRGRNEPKAKGPHHHQIQKLSVFFICFFYCVQKGEKVVFQNDISKPSWTLRGESHLGGVLFSQRKSIWNRGRQFQILKMLCKLLFMYLWLFAKDLWNGFTKRICKNKNMWCKRGPKCYIRKKHSLHIL